MTNTLADRLEQAAASFDRIVQSDDSETMQLSAAIAFSLYGGLFAEAAAAIRARGK